MAVTTEEAGNYKTATGSLLEVIEQLNEDDVKKTMLLDVGHDGTDHFAVYYGS